MRSPTKWSVATRGQKACAGKFGRHRCRSRQARPNQTTHQSAELQAAAAIGQSELMKAWDEAFARHGIKTAQILLTAGDVHDRMRYLNARNTILQLLRWDVVPIINENDTSASMKFGLAITINWPPWSPIFCVRVCLSCCRWWKDFMKAILKVPDRKLLSTVLDVDQC